VFLKLKIKLKQKIENYERQKLLSEGDYWSKRLILEKVKKKKFSLG
jgi:hypothetical protein